VDAAVAPSLVIGTCSELYKFAMKVPYSDQDDQVRLAATTKFFQLEEGRKRALAVFIDAAAQELGTKFPKERF